MIIDHNFLLRVQVRVAAAAELVLVFKLATEIAPDVAVALRSVLLELPAA